MNQGSWGTWPPLRNEWMNDWLIPALSLGLSLTGWTSRLKSKMGSYVANSWSSSSTLVICFFGIFRRRQLICPSAGALTMAELWALPARWSPHRTIDQQNAVLSCYPCRCQVLSLFPLQYSENISSEYGLLCTREDAWRRLREPGSQDLLYACSCFTWFHLRNSIVGVGFIALTLWVVVLVGTGPCCPSGRSDLSRSDTGTVVLNSDVHDRFFDPYFPVTNPAVVSYRDQHCEHLCVFWHIICYGKLCLSCNGCGVRVFEKRLMLLQLS